MAQSQQHQPEQAGEQQLSGSTCSEDFRICFPGKGSEGKVSSAGHLWPQDPITSFQGNSQGAWIGFGLLSSLTPGKVTLISSLGCGFPLWLGLTVAPLRMAVLTTWLAPIMVIQVVRSFSSRTVTNSTIGKPVLGETPGLQMCVCDITLSNPPTWASQVFGLQACTTLPSFKGSL